MALKFTSLPNQQPPSMVDNFLNMTTSYYGKKAREDKELSRTKELENLRAKNSSDLQRERLDYMKKEGVFSREHQEKMLGKEQQFTEAMDYNTKSWSSDEREIERKFLKGERINDQDWRTRESAINRSHESDMQTDRQLYGTSMLDKNQSFAKSERIDTQAFTKEGQEALYKHQNGMQMNNQDWAALQADLDRTQQRQLFEEGNKHQEKVLKMTNKWNTMDREDKQKEAKSTMKYIADQEKKMEDKRQKGDKISQQQAAKIEKDLIPIRSYYNAISLEQSKGNLNLSPETVTAEQASRKIDWFKPGWQQNPGAIKNQITGNMSPNASNLTFDGRPGPSVQDNIETMTAMENLNQLRQAPYLQAQKQQRDIYQQTAVAAVQNGSLVLDPEALNRGELKFTAQTPDRLEEAKIRLLEAQTKAKQKSADYTKSDDVIEQVIVNGLALGSEPAELWDQSQLAYDIYTQVTRKSQRTDNPEKRDRLEARWAEEDEKAQNKMLKTIEDFSDAHGLAGQTAYEYENDPRKMSPKYKAAFEKYQKAKKPNRLVQKMFGQKEPHIEMADARIAEVVAEFRADPAYIGWSDAKLRQAISKLDPTTLASLMEKYD